MFSQYCDVVNSICIKCESCAKYSCGHHCFKCNVCTFMICNQCKKSHSLKCEDCGCVTCKNSGILCKSCGRFLCYDGGCAYNCLCKTEQ